MEVNDKLIEKLSDLSRLKFNDEEKEEIKKDLQQMISFIDKMNEVNTNDVEPLLHMTNEVNILREDEVKGMISQEDALKNAPVHDDSFFKVPKVIKR
jgi:aspartyl-tRNA(Asn)/glutamyl-tRNA(Gln) amidotransferase subunit C